jgi:hypothetical protein
VSGSFNGAINPPVLKDAGGAMKTAMNERWAPGESRHFMIDKDHGHVSFNMVPSGQLRYRVAFGDPKPATSAQNAVYLPFHANRIASAVLPRHGANGVRYFFTEAMSGCSVFIDRSLTTNHLIVYHGNAMQCPVPDLSDPTAMSPAALRFLDGQHHDAQNDWIGATGKLAVNGGLAPAGSIHKVTYNRKVAATIAQKKVAEKKISKLDMVVGTNVFGFYVGGQWEFWFQTYGYWQFDRNLFHPQRRTAGKHVNVTTDHTGLVISTPVIIDHGKFCDVS